MASAERDWLYPCASLDAAGVPVAAGTDAPFGPADPWLAIATAASRRTPAGAVLGRAERVTPRRALRLWQTAAHDARQIRAVRPGQPADLCVLTEPLPRVLAAPGTARVRATIVADRVVWPRA